MAHGKDCTCKACMARHEATESPSKEAREEFMAKKGRKSGRKSPRGGKR